MEVPFVSRKTVYLMNTTNEQSREFDAGTVYKSTKDAYYNSIVARLGTVHERFALLRYSFDRKARYMLDTAVFYHFRQLNRTQQELQYINIVVDMFEVVFEDISPEDMIYGICNYARNELLSGIAYQGGGIIQPSTGSSLEKRAERDIARRLAAEKYKKKIWKAHDKKIRERFIKSNRDKRNPIGYQSGLLSCVGSMSKLTADISEGLPEMLAGVKRIEKSFESLEAVGRSVQSTLPSFLHTSDSIGIAAESVVKASHPDMIKSVIKDSLYESVRDGISNLVRVCKEWLHDTWPILVCVIVGWLCRDYTDIPLCISLVTLILTTLLPKSVKTICLALFDTAIGKVKGLNYQAGGFIADLIPGITSLFCTLYIGKSEAQRWAGEFQKRVSNFSRARAGIEEVSQWVLNIIKELANLICDTFGFKRLEFLQSRVDGVSKWEERVLEAVNLDRSADDKSNNTEFVQQLLALQTEGINALTLFKGTGAESRIERRLREICDMLMSRQGAINSSKNFRQEPVCLMLRGMPGVGKTAITVAVSVFIQMAAGLTPDVDAAFRNIYQQGESEYYNGYVGQNVLVCDDAGQIRPIPGKPNEIERLIKFVSMFAVPLNFADLPNKGKNYFLSKLILCTTNLTNLHEYSNTLISLEALGRRIRCYDLELTNGPWRKSNGRLDWDGFVAVCKERLENTELDLWERFPWEAWTAYEWDLLTETDSARRVGGPLVFREVLRGVAEDIQHRAHSSTEMKDILQAMFDPRPVEQEAKPCLDGVPKLVRLFERKLAYQAGPLGDDDDSEVAYSTASNWDCHTAPIRARYDFVKKELYPTLTPPQKVIFDSHILRYTDAPFVYSLCGIECEIRRDVISQLYQNDYITFDDLSTLESDDTLMLTKFLYNCRENRLKGAVLNDLSFWRYYSKTEEVTTIEECVTFQSPMDASLEPLELEYCDKLTMGEFLNRCLSRSRKWFNAISPRIKCVLMIATVSTVAVGLIIGLVSFFKYLFGKKDDTSPKGPSDGDKTDETAPTPGRYSRDVLFQSGFNSMRPSTDVQDKAYRHSWKLFYSKDDIHDAKYADVAIDERVQLLFSDAKVIGQINFIHGSLMVMPAHFDISFKNYLKKGVCEDKGFVYFRNSIDPNTIEQHTLSQFLDEKMFPRWKIPGRDITFVSHRFKTEGADLTKYFITRKELETYKATAPEGRLDLIVVDRVGRLETVNSRTVYAVGKLRHLNSVNVNNGDTVNEIWKYTANTTMGDCGAMLSLWNGKRAAGHVLLGMHMGGDESYGTYNGYSSVLTRDDVDEAMTKLNIVRDHFIDRVSAKVGLESPPTAVPTMVYQNATISEIDEIAADAEFLDEQSFKRLGKITDKRFIPNMPPTTKLYKTHFFDSMGPCRLLPAQLSAARGETHPLETALKPYRTIACPIRPFVQKWGKYAVGIALKRFKNATVNTVKPVLTYEQAIKGEPLLQLRAIPRGTSPGWPWNCVVSGGKQAFFGSNEEYELEGPLYDTLIGECEEIIVAARNNERLAHVCTDFLKDELRPEEKVRAGMTRLIAATPLAYLIVVRRYFGAAVTAMMRHAPETGLCPGIKVYQDWHKLVHGLTSKGTAVFDGDFSKFDSSQVPYILWLICDAINEWYDDGEENARIRKVLWMDLVYSRHLAGDGRKHHWLYQWLKSLPSGHPLTSFVNSIYAMTVLVLAYIDTTGRTDFNEMVAAYTFGDDNVSNVDDEVKDKFNQVTVAASLMKLLNMKYTAGHKDRELEPYTVLGEVTFLKRGFRYEEGRGWLCPLDVKSFLYTHYFCRNPKLEPIILKDCIENALVELTMHGQPMWDEFAPQLMSSMRELGQEADHSSRDEYALEVEKRAEWYW